MSKKPAKPATSYLAPETDAKWIADTVTARRREDANRAVVTRILYALERRDALQYDFDKCKPDLVQYHGDGSVAARTYSEAGLKAMQHAEARLQKMTAAITAAMAGDLSKLDEIEQADRVSAAMTLRQAFGPAYKAVTSGSTSSPGAVVYGGTLCSGTLTVSA